MIRKNMLKSLLIFMLMVFSLNSVVYAKSDEQKKREKIKKLMEMKQELIRKKIERQKELAKKIAKLEQKSANIRNSAIKSYENYIKRQGNKKSGKAANALFQLGQLYYSKEKDDYQKKYDTYTKLLAKFDKGKISKEPKEPVKSYKNSLYYFKRLLNEYPKYSDRDVSLYKVGVIYEELGEPKQGLPYFMELGVKFPNSKYAQRAFLRVGGYYYEENKMDSALYYFKQVSMEGAGVDNWGIAQYRIAKCYSRKGDYQKAIQQFFTYIALVDKKYFTKKAFRSESIEELGSIYAEIDNGAEQCEKDIQTYYPQLANQESYLFFKIGMKSREYDKLPNAVRAFKKLLSKYPNYPDAPKALYNIIDIYFLEKKFEKANQARIQMVNNYNKNSQWAQNNSNRPKTIMKAQEYVEQALALVPLYFHDKAEKTKNPDMYKQAIKYYEMYLDMFSTKDPLKVYEYRFYLASCYQSVKRYREAAKTFDDIVTMDTSKFPMDRLKKLKFDKETAAYNAVLAYSGIMEETVKDYPSEFNSPAVQDFIKASKRYLKLFPKKPSVDKILINLAAAYYKSKKFKDAAKLYENLVANYKKSQFYFDAYKYLAQSYIYDSQYVKGEKIMNQYLAEFPKMSADDKDKALILLGSAIFKQAEAARDSGNIELAIKNFMRIHKVAPKSKVADVGIQNAAVTYEKQKQYVKAAHIFIYLQKAYPKSKYAIPSLIRAAENFKADSAYDSAAATYELVAKNYQDTADSWKSIYVAAQMYDSLKMYNKAAQEYEKVPKLVKSKFKKAAEAMYFAGRKYELAENWNDAVRVYKIIESKYPKSEYLTQAIYSIAVTYEKQKKYAKASKYYENYADKYLAKDPKLGFDAYVRAADNELKVKKVDYDRADLLLDKALKAFNKYAKKYAISDYYAAKTMFLKGEVARARMKATPFGGYTVQMKKGQLDMKKINEKQDQKKQDYLKKATELYAKVAKYKVEEWTLKANNAIGYMMYEYATDFDNQKLVVKARKKSERKSMEIGLKIKVIKEAAKNLYIKAIERFQVNVDYGIKNRIVTDAIDSAKKWMPKAGLTAAKMNFDEAKLFRSSPVPAELKGTEEEQYFKEELADKAADVEALALPLLKDVLKACYDRYIDNEYTAKIKDEIRRLDASDKSLLWSSKTPEQPIVRKGKEDAEYLANMDQLNKLVVAKMPFEQKILQIKSLSLTMNRRIEEEKQLLAKARETNKQLDAKIKAVVKEIFKLGGGVIEEEKPKKDEATQDKENVESTQDNKQQDGAQTQETSTESKSDNAQQNEAK